MIVFFALAAWGAAVNVLTDSVFLARNASQYNLWLNSCLQGAVRLTCVVLAAGLGAAGLVLSTGLAVTITGITSVAVIGRVLRIPVWCPPRRGILAGALPFLAGTYVSSLLYLVPLIVVPLLLIRQAGAAGNAHYFVAFQIAMLLYASSDAVGQSVFAQASGAGPLRPVLVKSALTLGAVTVAGLAAGELLAAPVLALFGGDYVQHSLSVLRALLLASVPVALNVWSSFVCRICHRLRALVLANVACLVTTVTLTCLWASRSLILVALAWALGNLAAAAVGGASLVPLMLSGAGRRAPGHRRTGRHAASPERS
jgi:O-antigen/teichoic acid export membrane protein